MPGGGGTYLLDYGAGNVLSVINAVRKVGHESLRFIRSAEDFDKADKLIFPGGLSPSGTMCCLHQYKLPEGVLTHLAIPGGQQLVRSDPACVN